MYQPSLLGGNNGCGTFGKIHTAYGNLGSSPCTISTPAGRVVAYWFIIVGSIYTNVNPYTGEIGDPLSDQWYYYEGVSGGDWVNGAGFRPTALTDSSITFPVYSQVHTSQGGLIYKTVSDF